MAVVFKNNAKTTFSSGINDSATSISVVDGSVFPSLGAGEVCFVTFDDGVNNEIVKVTAISSNTLTVVRAQESTSARSFSAGDDVELRLTAGILGLFSQTGVAITDEIEAYLDANGLTFPDNIKAYFGTGNDLEIYHDGSNSIISETGTGGIKIFTAGVATSGFYKVGGEELATFEPDGPVTLYHNDSAKLATSSNGIDVTGNILLDDGDPRLYFQTGSSHYNWKIAAQDSTNKGFEISSGAADGAATNDTYTPRIVIEADTGDVGIGTTSPAGKLMVREDTAANPARIIVSNGGNAESGTSSRLSFYEGTTEKSYIERRRDGSGKTAFVTPADDNPFVWENASGEFMRFTSGNVGIGTTSPDAALDVSGEIYAGTGTIIPYLSYSNGNSTGIIGTKSNHSLEVRINNSEKMRLTSTGLGIGTTSPATKLHVMTASNGASTVGGASDELILENSSDCGLTIRSGSSSDGVISFADADDHNVGQVYYEHDNNAMVFRTNDSERVRINSSGNVGIGTSSPDGTSRLTLVHPSGTNGRLISLYRSAGAYGFHLGVDSNSHFNIYDNNGTSSLMAIAHTTGNVGIGTSSPSYPLDVRKNQAGYTYIAADNANSAASGTGSGFAVTESGSIAWYMRGERDGTGKFNIGNSANRLTIDSSGNVGIGTTSPSFSAGSGLEISRAGPATLRLEDTDGTTGATELVQVDADGYLLTRQSSSALIFGINSSEKMRLASSGDVGIGDSSPLAKLEVAGSIKATNRSTGHTGEAGVTLSYNTSSSIALLETWQSKPLVIDTFNYQQFNIGNTLAMFIDGTNRNVGIGTNSPSAPLVVSNGGAAGMEFHPELSTDLNRLTNYDRTASAYMNFKLDALTQQFNISGSEKMRLTSTGLGIGTTSPEQKLHIKDGSNPASPNGSVIIEGQRDGTANLLELRARDHSSTSSALPNGQGGIIRMNGFDGSDFEEMAFIGYQADGAAVADGDAPSRLIFGTTTDGSGATTEKMRIDNAGRLGLGTTSPSYKLHLDAASDGINISGSSAFVRWNSGDMQIRNAGSYSMAFDTYDGSALTEKMTIDTQGNVKVSKGGISYDGEGKMYSWRAQNNSGNASNYTKIASVSGSHGTRFYINVYGRSQGYSDGVLGAMATIVGQINNDNNIDLMYYNFYADNDAIDGAGHVDTGSCTADIYVQTGTYSELVAQGGISDGTLTPYGDKTGSSAPTGHVAASSRIVLVQNASGQVGINDISPSDTLDVNGTVSLKNTSATAANYIHMPRGGGITLYGDANQHHGIFSRNQSNSSADDIMISTYGALYVDLDSNDNNSASADFIVGKHNSTSNNLFNLSGETGNLTILGNITAYGSPSDLRLKENIATIENPLDKVSQLRGVTFNYKEDGSKSTGLIAQELEKVLPEVVYETEDINDSDNNFKAVRYGNVVGLLVEAIKELKAEVEELKKNSHPPKGLHDLDGSKDILEKIKKLEEKYA